MIVFLNGNFMDETSATVHITDRGLMIGDGIFDTLLAENGALVDASLHHARLARHGAVMGMDIDTAPLAQTAAELLTRNHFTNGRYAVRTTVTRGPGARGLAAPENPALTIIMRATPAPPSAVRPPRLVTIQTVRRNEGSPLSRIKSTQYGDSMLALMAAQKAGADDALLLNNAGNVACASTSNIYILRDDEWLTPRLEDGAMDGVNRARLLQSGAVREARITAPMLLNCDAAALSNSIAGIRPVEKLDGRTLEHTRVPRA